MSQVISPSGAIFTENTKTVTLSVLDNNVTTNASLLIPSNAIPSNIIDVVGVNVTPSISSIQIGETLQLTESFSPSNASDQSGVWSSSDTNIAIVNQDGIVTGVTDGNATITFTSTDGGFTDTCSLTVEAISVTSVTVTPSNYTLTEGNTVQLSVAFAPLTATDQTGTWSSSDTNIATVNSNGLVTTLNDGSVTITYTSNDGGFTDTCAITVEASTIAVTGVDVVPSTSTISIGQTQQLTVNFTPSNATNQTGTWSTADSNIATVDQNGLVTSVSDGSTLISFTSNDGFITDSCSMTVDNEPVFLPAFSTAYGGGAYATGGRGYDTYKVTNLNDSGTGSLRQAVSDANTAGGGNIIFDVSGVINLASILGLGSNITVAGQTAPSGGITIDGERVFVADADNLIVRYIRFRGGIDGDNDSVTVRNIVTNQIWDHCSFGFGKDEGASWYETLSNPSDNVENLTVQRCLFGENSKGSIIGTESGAGVADNLSFNYNLFYNNSHRFPNTSGTNANIEVINNVVWNVGSRLVRTNGSGQNLNHIGNYYHYNDTGINDDRINAFSYENGYPNIYTSGNKIVAPTVSTPLASNVSAMNADNTLSWKHFIDGTSTPQGTRNKGDQLETEYFTNTQHSLIGRSTTILNVDSAFTNVLNDVGANKFLNGDGTLGSGMDAEDTDYINQINLGNYTTPLGLNTTEMAVTPITSVSRDGSFYGNNQYIPSAWLTANGHSNTTTIHNEVQPSGYTLLEEYINQVDIVVEATGVTVTPETATIAVGETQQLTRTMIPANATDKTGVWSSLNDSIATVDSNGLVTGVSEGIVSVSFTTNDGSFVDSCGFTITAGAFDSGLILNGTFDDATNLTNDANWTIAIGVASYDNSADAYLNLDLSGDLLTVAHTITFDISNSTSDAQIEWVFRNNGSLVQKDVVTYVGGDGAYSYNFTPLSTANEFSVRGRTGGGSFDLDNISLTAD